MKNFTVFINALGIGIWYVNIFAGVPSHNAVFGLTLNIISLWFLLEAK